MCWDNGAQTGDSCPTKKRFSTLLRIPTKIKILLLIKFKILLPINIALLSKFYLIQIPK